MKRLRSADDTLGRTVSRTSAGHSGVIYIDVELLPRKLKQRIERIHGQRADERGRKAASSDGPVLREPRPIEQARNRGEASKPVGIHGNAGNNLRKGMLLAIRLKSTQVDRFVILEHVVKRHLALHCSRAAPVLARRL